MTDARALRVPGRVPVFVFNSELWVAVDALNGSDIFLPYFKPAKGLEQFVMVDFIEGFLSVQEGDHALV